MPEMPEMPETIRSSRANLAGVKNDKKRKGVGNTSGASEPPKDQPAETVEIALGR